ncbi:MAG: NADH-quinone oxidoreductase subunit C [Armatimonadetes bacterium]|nr:NADH-quinone oxidoreductase subunit C [Armatimonadota bacterium]
MSDVFQRQDLALSDMRGAVRNALKNDGWRFGHATARVLADSGLALEALLLDTTNGAGLVLSARIPDGTTEYPSLTPQVPAAHWAERAIWDFFGLKADGHPRWKRLILHEAWPADFAPLRDDSPGDTESAPNHYEFMEVHGEGVHEIPVGPIHAGIIEPGHFRFSCLGEIVTNLEIRLGYQHRGVERRLCEVPWQQTRFLAESASSDTTVGNALAHSVAMEQILGIIPPPRAQALRTIALEIERVASHLGDFGGLSADIGYSVGAATFARLRGSALGLSELLAGTRFQRAFVRPGGVARDLDDSRRMELAQALSELALKIEDSLPLVLENPAVIERMEGTGRLSPSLAREFGIVGPAGRASGSRYDARTAFRHGVFPELAPVPAWRESGDVLARAQVRADEIIASLSLLTQLLDSLPQSPTKVALDDSLPSDRIGVGVVEAWRGELIHWITTDNEGRIRRYAIKDPSFNNWTGLAIAVRGNLVADFPLCNKSFSLSYSGNDL